MATPPLVNCKGGCCITPKGFPRGCVEHGAKQRDMGRFREPSRRRPKVGDPAWRKAIEAEEAHGLRQVMVSHRT